MCHVVKFCYHAVLNKFLIFSYHIANIIFPSSRIFQCEHFSAIATLYVYIFTDEKFFTLMSVDYRYIISIAVSVVVVGRLWEVGTG